MRIGKRKYKPDKNNINLIIITLALSLRAQFCVIFSFQVLDIPIKRTEN
jgi:hypothetical protein